LCWCGRGAFLLAFFAQRGEVFEQVAVENRVDDMINLFLKWLRPFFKQEVITSEAEGSRRKGLARLLGRDLLRQSLRSCLRSLRSVGMTRQVV